jgi:hypothetical protein
MNGDNRQKPEVMAPISSWRFKGIDRTPGSKEWLHNRSVRFLAMTQGKGKPMVYGSGKK